MFKRIPKYFHYFLSSLLFDNLLLGLSISFIFKTENALVIIIIWSISNFLNYPRVASRRYISYYKILLLSFRQLITFFTLYSLVYALFHDKLELVTLTQMLPILIILLSRILFTWSVQVYRQLGKGYNRFLIIGDTSVMTQLKTHFLAKKSYGNVFEGKMEVCDFDKIEKLIFYRELNEIYCSSQAVSQNDIAQLLNFSYRYGVNVHVISDNNAVSDDSIPTNVGLEYGELNLEKYPLVDRKNLWIKRIFDFFFSLFVTITVLSWVTLILGLLIKLESRGPVFFKQPRAGRNGKYFMCYKFRSMRVSSGTKQATKNDPRITRIGKVIRKLSIDELPQFINVILGQMSIVGPRPHIKDLNDKYDVTIDNYNERILVKPGITGLSQITGHRGETDGNESMGNRVRRDILYIRTWSMSLDLIIIHKTIIDVVFFKNKDVY